MTRCLEKYVSGDYTKAFAMSGVRYPRECCARACVCVYVGAT